MERGLSRIVMIIAAFLSGIASAGAAGSDTNSNRGGSPTSELSGSPPAAGERGDSSALPRPRRPPPDTAKVSDRLPFRFVGFGGTGRSPEFIALTDGANSFVARAGDIIAERYRIDELRAREFVLTDMKSGEKGIIVLYTDIQSQPGEPTSQDAAAAVFTSPTEAIPVTGSSSGSSPVDPTPQANQDAPGGEGRPGADLSAMIAPPPVNRAEQAMPMELKPPPDHDPLIVTTPAQDIPMITTPSRREHQEQVDIPLGPEN